MKKKIVVVMPAYNAAKTLIKTYQDIPKDIVDEIILVDDASNDKTAQMAKKLNLKVIIHPKNLGYGGNQKTCYKAALDRKADIIIMIHPDYQYDPKLIPYLVLPIKQGYFDIMLGSRIRSRKETLDGGMPIYKYIGNRLLTFIENLIVGISLSEYHTGLRAFRVDIIKKLPFEKFSNDFVFDQEFLISALNARYTVGEIAVPVRYFPEASSINFKRSVKYGIMTLWTLVLFMLAKIGYKSRIFSYNA